MKCMPVNNRPILVVLTLAHGIVHFMSQLNFMHDEVHLPVVWFVCGESSKGSCVIYVKRAKEVFPNRMSQIPQTYCR